VSLGRYGQPEAPHRTLIRHAFVRKACACGGVIEAKTPLPPDVQAAVVVHSRSTGHREGMVRWHEALG
jgi:hypothetical protein